MIKKIIFLVVFVSSLSASTISIAVAANVSYAIKPLVAEFNKLYPDINVRVTLGSSGKLAAQIKHNAPFGLFMSADMNYPDKLYKDGIAITKPRVYAQGSLAFLSKHKQDFSKGIKLLEQKNVKKIDSMAVEREVGRIIKEKTGAKVNLKNPSKVIKVVLLKDRIYLALLVEKRDKEYFQKNRPHLRAYFHPGCILPKLARCMVNLARLKEGDILLDPFCGTGGFLIEAGLIGAKLVGCDIDWRMASGTLINLEEYNLLDKVIKVKRLDAKCVKNFLNELNINKVDAIVTDPPYGISTAKKGEIEKILEMLPEVVKENGYFVFAYPKKIELDMKLEGLYKVYIHKGLIRHIHVYKKI